MGLDMYAFRVSKEKAINDFEFDNSDLDLDKHEISYWRKFNALHGWMERLYRDRGGSSEMFNCCPVRLHLEDLDQLESDLKKNKLKPTAGFFFGAQEIYPEDIESTKKFIENARQAIKEGYDVYYDSWW